MRYLLAGIVLVAPSATWGIVHAQETCPVSCIRILYDPQTCSSRVAVDSTYSVCNDFNCGQGRVQYDLAAGQVGASVYAPDGGNFTVGVRAVDDYRVVGLNDGQPLTFEARLEVDGANNGLSPWPKLPYGSGSFTVEIREGDANAQTASCGNGSWKLTLAIPIVVNAGTSFRIACAVDAGAATGYAHADGRLLFSGLPPGASVVSCQGYRFDVPVPAIRTSWGSVKSQYR
jgi:hypothetical protein